MRKERIPNRLRKYRRIMGYTQVEVARLLGLTCKGRVSEWELGKRFPGVRNLIKLSILYHTLIDCFYADLRDAIRQDFEGRMPEPGEGKGVKNRPP